ncbi:MAG TPA: alpha/beta hydrolase [Acidimicrobiales bacterium]|jgi:pimeloyl-ACP methyl ester carboxylesterase|nr:alpha/beta hydrolase [Acidimicrobiales bacterium]
MPYAAAGAVQICYDTLGEPGDAPLLLISGLGNQLIMWPDDFCLSLVDRGFFVVRFDNRDCGLSTILPDGSEYTLSDMAGDATAVLDALDLPVAHVVGQSLGAMIAQTMAIEHRARVLTLTSISANTGNLEYGRPSEEALTAISQPREPTLDGAVEADVANRRLWASPSWFDEAATRAYFRAAAARAFTPGASLRQLAAVLTGPDREADLRRLDIPTLVIHGTLDPLISPDGGQRTADLVRGAELLLIDGLAHDLPVQVWQQVISAITAHVARQVVA